VKGATELVLARSDESLSPREAARAYALARGADFAFAPDDPELKQHRKFYLV